MPHLEPNAFGFHVRNRPAPRDGSRLVLRAYALLVGIFGGITFFWGPMWLEDPSLPGVPFGRAALVRIAGAVVVAAAYCAAGFHSVEDDRTRHRCLVWFAGAHVIVLLALLTQRLAILGSGLADLGLWFLLVCIIALASAEYQYPAVALIRLLGATAESPAERRRAAHERQIREAAGQQERNRLARELHDSIKQQIFVIQTAAATAQVRFDADATGSRQALAQIREAARDAMTELEVMLDQLRAVPLANAGLVAALEKQSEAVGLQTGARVTFSVGELPPDGLVAAGTQQALLRVAQEALANVTRHARASEVSVSLGGTAGRLELRVEDNGAGIGPGRHGGTGLSNMATRASEIGGALDVFSPAAVSGTIVRFSVPYGETINRPAFAWVGWAGALIVGALVTMRSPVAGTAVLALAAAAFVWLIVRRRRPPTR